MSEKCIRAFIITAFNGPNIVNKINNNP
jgi:hypothetical protein